MCSRSPRCNVSSTDRKSTRLNSSHLPISYAVFCLKKKPRHLQFLLTLTSPHRNPLRAGQKRRTPPPCGCTRVQRPRPFFFYKRRGHPRVPPSPPPPAPSV